MKILQRLRLSTDQLWVLIVLAGFGFYTALAPLPPNDFWWHLKVGEIIYTTGRIPATNLFGWTLPADYPFVYGAWLAEYLFYVLYRWGGLALLAATRTLLALLAFWLVGYEARRRSGSWRLAALAVALAYAMTLNNLPIRTQNWSWLPFMGLFILLSRYAAGELRGPWLLFCPALVAFWANVHGAFVLGPIMAGIFVAGEALRMWLRQPGARSWRQIGWLAVIGGLVLLASLVNPQGIGLWEYVRNMMTDPPSQGLVVEWQSPAPVGIPNTVFFLSILALSFTLAYSRYRPTPTETLLLAAFLWLAWSGQRYIIWFGMIAMPVLAQGLRGLQVHPPAMRAQRNWLNSALAALLFIPVLLAQPWFVAALPLPATYLESVIFSPEHTPLSTGTPVAAVEYLRAYPGGKLFNEMGYGSYLIWALPEQPVFIDARVELYPYELWLDYIRIGQGVRSLALLEQYGVERVLLDVAAQAELLRLLERAPDWRCEYADKHTQLWQRELP